MTFTDEELAATYEAHNMRNVRVWEPGDTYTVCVMCNKQIGYDVDVMQNKELCDMQELIKEIQESRAEAPISGGVSLKDGKDCKNGFHVWFHDKVNHKFLCKNCGYEHPHTKNKLEN